MNNRVLAYVRLESRRRSARKQAWSGGEATRGGSQSGEREIRRTQRADAAGARRGKRVDGLEWQLLWRIEPAIGNTELRICGVVKTSVEGIAAAWMFWQQGGAY